MNKLFITLLVVVALVSCKSNNDNIDIYQGDRDNIIDVKSLITEFDTGDVILGGTTQVVNKLGLIFFKSHNTDDIVQVFDAKTSKHLGSFAQFGHGPDEILIPGRLQINVSDRTAYLFDHGQLKIEAFNVDSALQLSDYKPWVKQRFDIGRFPDRYIWINDTLGFGRLILPDIEHGGYTQGLCRYNLITGDVTEIGELHNNGEKSMIGVSTDHKLLVEAYSTNDLIVIYDFDGNVLHRIYGPDWSSRMRPETKYFNCVAIVDDKILAAYSGTEDYHSRYVQVFDLDGNYEKTLDIGHDIYDMVYAPDINGLIFTLDSDIQFGVLNLEESIGIKPKKQSETQSGIKIVVNSNSADSLQQTKATSTDKAEITSKPEPEDNLYFINQAYERQDSYSFDHAQITDGIVKDGIPLYNNGKEKVDIDHITADNSNVTGHPGLDFLRPGMILGFAIVYTQPDKPLDCNLYVHYKQDVPPTKLRLKYTPRK